MASAAEVHATWRKITEIPDLRRSSNNVVSIGESVYIFGGELKPREPRDNEVWALDLGNGGRAANQAVSAIKGASVAPSPRVGAASCQADGKMYIFSGRGGPEMAPLEERGAIWEFDPVQRLWTEVKPSNSTAPYPAGRSYHAMAADGQGLLYVHAGCPEKGRLGDFWAYDIAARSWKELASPQGPPRGGSSIACFPGGVARMNGFDGREEVGGSVDIYDASRDEWKTHEYRADGIEGPSPRSVSGLFHVSIDAQSQLVTLFGESDPSNLGHQGAGKMLGDAWTYSVREGVWKRLATQVSNGGSGPAPRGWFAADSIEGKNEIVVAGGLAEDNSRLGDVWVLGF